MKRIIIIFLFLILNTSIASAIEEIELDKSKLAPPKEILPTPTQKIEVNKHLLLFFY